ncbi:hypothetical protein BDV12DRAFT_174513 [Aspergillus spectabilis]
MIVTILATLESQDLLKRDSEVKNLGFVMALYLEFADELRPYGCLNEDPVKGCDSGKFDAYVLAYAKKHNIKLQGPSKIDEFVANLGAEYDEEDEESRIELPARSADPCKWSAAYKKYAKDYGAITPGKRRKELEVMVSILPPGAVPSVRSRLSTIKTCCARMRWTTSKQAWLQMG